MADKEHLALIKQGVVAWNKWRQSNLVTKPDLREANLREAHLGGANLKGADLRGADLIVALLNNADLSGANLGEAILTGADLRAAGLKKSNLIAASLRATDLRAATLIVTDLSGATLRRASVAQARLLETNLADVDLTGAKGLDACIHRGPSVIDHRTLAKSRNLPLSFLRGCGLPDTLIEFLRSLVNEPLQFHSCFISHSSLDQPFAERIYADLKNNGVRCWFAPEDIKAGIKTHEQIDRAIQKYDKLLLVLSEHSMGSNWVQFEIRKALKQEIRTNKRVLFSIRLVSYESLQGWECFDADTGKDLATEIREYYIPDFSEWKNHDAYKQGFERLLRDLKAEDRIA